MQEAIYKKPVSTLFPLLKNSFALSAGELAKELSTDTAVGLTRLKAESNKHQYGLNVLQQKKSKSLLLIFFQQLKSPMIWLLGIAAIVSFLFENFFEGYAIIGVIFINAGIGFLMEWQAARSMDALKKLDVVNAKVIREGRLQEIPSEEITLGDILFVEAGDMISADARLFEVNQLQADESALTGESLPVEKQTTPLAQNTILAEQTNMIFKGTSAVKGNGKAIVTGTGLNTELGKISSLVENAEHSATPLEKKLEALTKKLIWITAFLAVLFFVAGWLQGQEIYVLIETSIAMAVAAIPEGLPIVATIALAFGMLRMARKNVIVKRLAAIETLGGTDIIFTDKTGTLTQNKIEVNTICTPDDCDEAGRNSVSFLKILQIAVLCNNAKYHILENKTVEIGDPLETALLKFAVANKTDIEKLNKGFPRIAEQAFSSETKMMGTLHQAGSSFFIAAKGAVEKILKKSSFIFSNGKIILFSENERRNFLGKAEQLSSKGLRVLAFAYKETGEQEKDFLHGLTFSGMIGFLDPPRMEVAGAMNACKQAGIKVVMVTGDHPATALNIAEKVKLTDNETEAVLNGKDFENIEQLPGAEKEKLLHMPVFARVSPKQKLDLIHLYQQKGFIVGMTGDGVNDAPALKKADIGIAMGLRGTQIAKETADIILKDDSFLSIVTAVEQGRIIFENIRKFVIYLLSCNLSEILVITLAGVLHLSLPLLPLQILFLNMITDVFPALALGMGKGDQHILHHPPRNPKQPVIDMQDWYSILVYALVITLSIFSGFMYCHYYLGYPTNICNNIAFFSLAFAQLFHIFNLSSAGVSFFKNEITRNKHIWRALGLCLLIFAGVYLFEPVHRVLAVQYLTLHQWIIILVTSILPVGFIQLLKRTGIIL